MPSLPLDIMPVLISIIVVVGCTSAISIVVNLRSLAGSLNSIRSLLDQIACILVEIKRGIANED